jgi:hypothetical protein
MRVWFALSWVVSLACLRGLIRREAAFLRTPKRKEGRSVWQAIMASRSESAIAALSLAAAVVLVLSVVSVGTVALAVLLVWMAAVYSSAPWASFAAEGIRLTPLRTAYRRSSQSTGDWPETRMPTALAVALPVALVGLLAAALVAVTPPASPQPAPPPDLPQIGQAPAARPPAPLPVSTPTPTATPLPSPTRATTPRLNTPGG